MLSIDEAIAREKELAEIYRNDIVPKEDYHNMPWIDMENESNMRIAKEHEQLAEWLEELKQLREQTTWIPCSESLPNDCDNRFYMCIVENHEEDLPMFCQYEEECGFGFWQDIYDEHTLGFVDSIFNTNEELGYEKVIAWMPLPKPYKESD